MIMASNFPEEDTMMSDDGGSLSDSDSEAASDSDSDTKASDERNICKYYNTGVCRYGDKCTYEHICKPHVDGLCRYGTACRLNHNPTSYTAPEQDAPQGSRSQDSDDGDEDDDGRPYRWQLNVGQGWKDIANDFILEAQYSCPSTRGVNIYNTGSGAISIDFTKMRVLKKKNIRVRRKGWKQSEWLWYYRSAHGWCRYGGKGSKKAGQIQSSELERKYKSNPQDSVQFSVGSHTYEINFRGMFQKNVSSNHKRRVRRRPKYEPSQTVVMKQFSQIHLKSASNKTPVWQFEGRQGKWHNFRNTDGCSVSSEDIESFYQKHQNTMTFTVNGDRYTLDFTKMNQINQTTNAKRKIRRVERRY